MFKRLLPKPSRYDDDEVSPQSVAYAGSAGGLGDRQGGCGSRAPASGAGGTASVRRTCLKGMLRQVSKPCPKESGKGIPSGGWSGAGRRLGGMGNEERLVPKVHGRPCRDRASPGPPRSGPSPVLNPGLMALHTCWRPVDSCSRNARAWASGERSPSAPEAQPSTCPQHSQEHNVSVSKA